MRRNPLLHYIRYSIPALTSSSLGCTRSMPLILFFLVHEAGYLKDFFPSLPSVFNRLFNHSACNGSFKAWLAHSISDIIKLLKIVWRSGPMPYSRMAESIWTLSMAKGVPVKGPISHFRTSYIRIGNCCLHVREVSGEIQKEVRLAVHCALS